MKKLILSLVFLFTLGFSYGINLNKTAPRINNHEIVDNFEYQDSEISIESTVNFENNLKIEVAGSCTNFGASVFAAAIESGMDYNDAWGLGVDAMNICNVLVLLGGML